VASHSVKEVTTMRTRSLQSCLFSASLVLIASLVLPLEYQSQHPWTQPAQLDISDSGGAVLATQTISVLHPDDPDTQEVSLYWIEDAHLSIEKRRIPQTSTPEAAALEALLWGPAQQNAEGAWLTALPTPQQVLGFSGRTGDWGPRVTLRSLRQRDGLAIVDLSEELRAYGGDAQRASQIHAQITRTLLQFESIRDVQITIAGQRDLALEPSGPR
jgi:hypothetical protein